MDCTKVQEKMLDQMSASSASPDLSAHMAICADCTKLWQAMQVSSAALDEWTAPEPSPYFNTRFQARLAEVKREEAAPAGVMGWFRHSVWRPAMAGAMALAIAIGVGIYERPSVQPGDGGTYSQISPAVNDLQKLDKNEDMYADFEMLDDLQVNGSNSQPANSSTTTTTNPSNTEM